LFDVLFELDPARPRRLFIADEAFEAVAAFAVEHADESATLVVLGSSNGFPFRPRPSTIIVPGMPEGVIASMPTLESAGIASRLASSAGLPGCFDGSVVELASEWLAAQSPGTLLETKLYATGSAELLKVAQETARLLDLPIACAINRS